MGRVDGQVKVRGFRVEVGEVESVLASHPGVSAAVVTAWGEDANRHLVAYLVPSDATAGLPPVEEVRAFVGQRLPAFMVPAHCVELAALPLTANGKVDRAILPAPAPPDGDPDRYVAPTSPTEELLAGIWAEILDVAQVGVDDNFFHLGGHSLLATQVISRIRDVFRVEVPMSALFDRLTVRGLAMEVERAAPGVTLPAVTAAARDQPLPLSAGQQRLWFLHQLDPGSTEYVVPSRMWWPEVDVAALGAALTAVVARHEVLRTRLVSGAGIDPHQVIDPPSTLSVLLVDVSASPSPVSAAERLVAAAAAEPFDLAAGPLIRVVLIRLRPDQHLLALLVHHVISDDWSARILRRELSTLYEAFRAGRPDPLPPLPLQYADFAAWQRQWMSGDAMAAQLAYWRDRLASAPMLELPVDRARSAVRSSTGAVTRFDLPAEVADKLRALARDCDATLFMTLFAGLATVLARHSGQDDVVVGTPVANRNRSEVENLIGFFVNTLVLRTDLSGDPAFIELLGRVRAAAMGAYAHQDVPFEQVVDALVSERDRSRTPLFQVFFDYLAGPGPSGEARTVSSAGDRDGLLDGALQVRFDLAVTLEDRGAGLAGSIEYSTALFDATTVERMAGHLVTVLEAAANGPRRRLSQLPMLTAAEHDQVVRRWNDTAVPMPATGGVPELIVAQAGAVPDAVAVVSGATSLTYARLLERADRLANRLRRLGVGPESVVGLCLPRGVDLLVSVLAVWRAGGAYLPLDPEHPGDRLDFMLADSGASVLVGHRRSTPDLAAVPGEVLWLDDPAVQAALAGEPATAPAGTSHPDQLAYVIYTSGSTGRPKGVFSTHAGLLNRVTWMQERYDLAPGERVLHKTPTTFDVSVWELVWSLTVGASVVVAEPGRHGDLDHLVQLLEDQQIAVTHFVPSLFQLFVRHHWAGPLRHLRLVVCSGETLSAGDVDRLHARHAGVRVENLYGPTEASIDVSAWTCERSDGAAAVPIGRPVANTRLLVLDRRLAPVPVGVPGELYIGGIQLARGYGRRPALTAQRFVADPFAVDGARLYRTGDRACWRADGRLDFLDRLDHQVKVRGFRIEPGEIEAALTAHPGVRSAAILARGDAGDRWLAAYLVPTDPVEGLPAAGDLHDHLRRSLPEYMLPARYCELADLPLTPSGKLDRAALPALEGARPELAGAYRPPSGEAEESLAALWAEVLGVDRVGADDDFFALGGHSLLATRVLSRIRSLFGIDIPLSAVFDQPTVRRLAAVVEERIWSEIAHMSEAEVLQTLNAAPATKPDEDGVPR